MILLATLLLASIALVENSQPKAAIIAGAADREAAAELARYIEKATTLLSHSLPYDRMSPSLSYLVDGMRASNPSAFSRTIFHSSAWEPEILRFTCSSFAGVRNRRGLDGSAA